MSTSNFKPNMLAFARSLEVSEAIMYGTNSANPDARQPIEVTLSGLRGQSSEEKLNRDAAGASKAGKSNPQMTDVARLPIGCDTLLIECCMRVMPNTDAPSATDSNEAYRSYQDLAQRYGELGGFTELAARYIENVANGRFAWRNRGLSSFARVEISFGETEIAFDPFKLDADEILGLDAVKAALVAGSAADVDALVAYVAKGLSDEPADVFFRWVGRMLPAAEVYPSQEYAYLEGKKEKGAAARKLSSMRTFFADGYIRQATMHSQKIGAAVRAIDTWHGDAFYGAIPVNAYGGIQDAGIAIRHGNKAAPSLYDLMKKPALFLDDLEAGRINDNAHFMMACLVRGGVLGSTSKE